MDSRDLVAAVLTAGGAGLTSAGAGVLAGAALGAAVGLAVAALVLGLIGLYVGLGMADRPAGRIVAGPVTFRRRDKLADKKAPR